MKQNLKEIVFFLLLFISLPSLLAEILVSVSGTADYQVVFMFCSIAFLITYVFKIFLVNKLFRPQDKISAMVYFVLVWLIVIVFLRLVANLVLAN